MRHARSCWRAMRSKQNAKRALAKSTSQTFARRKNEEDEDEESEEDDENDGEDEDG